MTLVAKLRTPIPLTFPAGAFVYYVARWFSGGYPSRVELVPYSELGQPDLGWLMLGPFIDLRTFPFGYDVFPD